MKVNKRNSKLFYCHFFSLHSLKTEQWCHGINVILNVHCMHKSHDLFLSVFIVLTEQTARTCIWSHTQMQIQSYTPENILALPRCKRLLMWPVSGEKCFKDKNPARNMIFGMITATTSNMQHSISLLLSERGQSFGYPTFFGFNYIKQQS